MKKIIFAAVFLGSTMGLSATPLLVEAYQAGNISIPPLQYDTVTVVEVAFTLDTACYVQFSTGGLAALSRSWLKLDGVDLPPKAWLSSSVRPQVFGITYTYLVTSGEHTISFVLTVGQNDSDPTLCQNTYLQALIFLPDTAKDAVVERPEVEFGVRTASVISQGPYVSAPGASQLVDASGRVIENAIADGRVQISTLPPGTYFAKSEERTVVKIVKVE